MTQKKNFAESRLASGITSAATTLNLFTNDGQWFPSSDFYIGVYPSRYRTPTLARRAGKFEWIYVGTRTTDACTGLLRGQRGTVVLDHNVSGETYTVIHSLAVEDLQEVSAAALIPNVIYVRKTMNTDVTLRSYETEQAALDAIPTAGASKPTASNRYVILGDALSDFSGLSWTAHTVAGTAPYIRVVDVNKIPNTFSGSSLPTFNAQLYPPGSIFVVNETDVYISGAVNWVQVNAAGAQPYVSYDFYIDSLPSGPSNIPLTGTVFPQLILREAFTAWRASGTIDDGITLFDTGKQLKTMEQDGEVTIVANIGPDATIQMAYNAASQLPVIFYVAGTDYTGAACLVKLELWK